MRKKGNVGGSKSSKAIFFCHFGIFLAVAHANVAERSKDDLSSQENDVKGNIYRKEELLNDSDSAESFWNRNGIYDKLRQQKTDWGTDRGCRVQSHKIQRDRCYSPMSHPQSCFGAGLRQNYTIQNDTFGEFPDRLIFLRHFPRCWMRIAPIICLGHYRPCAEIAPTYITNKNADNNFVLLEQFSATACQNMLEQCEFIKHILLGRTVPKYFSCFGDQNYGNSKKRDFSDEKVLYREECKVDYTNVHPELAALANSSFLCLWPLVKSNTMTNNEVSVMTQASPLIDGCYLPCQSPLYPENSLPIFWGFSFVYYSLVALLILCAALTFIQLPSRSQLFPLQFHANILCNFFVYTLFCAFVAILALAFSILPISSNQLFGHFTTCLNTEGGGRIRRYPADFQIPEGKENGLCGLQSIMLNFTTISLNLGLFTILIKCYLLPIRPKLISYLIPSWNSHLLLLQNILLSFAYTLLDLFENKVSVDPVNGFCHFFLHGYSLTLRNSAMFLLITIVVHGLFCFLISIVRKKRKEEIKCSINGQQLLMSMNFECQQILPRQQNQPERLEMGTGMKTKTADVQQMHEESEEQQQQLVRQPFDSSRENNIVVMDNEMEPLNGAENYPEDGSDKEAKNSGSERFPFFFTNANMLLKKMACLWFFLLAIRIFVGHLLIGAEEESQLILSSINCSIHRTLLEGIPLDWIERPEYRQSPETDPHIRKQMLGSDVSAKFCELSTKSLHWHWIFMLSLGANILLVAFISLIVGQYTDYQRFERELDEKQAERIAMELREMKRRRDEQRRTKSRDGVEEHSGSAVYDKISSTDSLALPINSSNCNRPPPPHPPLASTIEVHNNSNGSGTSSDITSLFRSHFSLPAVFTRPQCQQQYCYGCYLAASTSAQRQNGQITDEVAPGSGKAQQWLECFGVAGSSVSTKNNQQTANGGIMRNRAGSDPVQISGQQQKQHYRRRHKLHIRNPPKQAREWRREARERRMENVPQLSSSSIFEQRESERADSRFGEIQQLDGYGKVNQPTTTLAPNSHYYYPQQLPYNSPAHLCPYHQLQVQWHDPMMFALQQQAFCSSAIFTNNLPQFPPFAEFLQYRNVNEAEGNGGEMVDVAAENAESKEENVEEAEIDGEELDDDEEVEQTQGSTTSANPDSSIASSTSDSDPNHSDSPDSFEEKRWEELMRKSSANTPSVDP